MFNCKLFITAALACSCWGATISIPTTIVNGTDTVGPTFTLPSQVLLTDTLQLTIRGEVFLQSNNRYGTNGAGVVSTAGTTGVGGTSTFSSFNYGALLFGNDTIGFFQMFPANAADGLGSATPPSLMTMGPVTLASLGFVSDLAAGTVLNLKVADTLYGDNAGSYTVFGQFNTSSSVPEPGSLMLLGGGLALLGLRKVRQ